VDVDTVLAGLFELIAPHLTEKQRRLLAGAGARTLGRGGGARMARISRLSRPTVYAGVRELAERPDPGGRVRRPGGGPKRRTTADPGLLGALDALVDPDTRGDPDSPLRWTCKSTRELAEAMAGRFGSHHAVVARSILDHLDFLDHTIDALTAQVVARTRSFAEQVELLAEVPGLDQATIQVILAETGGDMARFPTPAQLASWTGLCPGNHESAGKRRNVATPPGNRWLRRALIEAARAAARTRGSYFAAQYRQIARRRGPNKAAVAVAHSLVVVIWMVLATGEPFHDLGEDYFQRCRDPGRESRRLVHQLEQLGYTVTLQPAEAVA